MRLDYCTLFTVNKVRYFAAIMRDFDKFSCKSYGTLLEYLMQKTP